MSSDTEAARKAAAKVDAAEKDAEEAWRAWASAAQAAKAKGGVA